MMKRDSGLRRAVHVGLLEAELAAHKRVLQRLWEETATVPLPMWVEDDVKALLARTVAQVETEVDGHMADIEEGRRALLARSDKTGGEGRE